MLERGLGRLDLLLESGLFAQFLAVQGADGFSRGVENLDLETLFLLLGGRICGLAVFPRVCPFLLLWRRVQLLGKKIGDQGSRWWVGCLVGLVAEPVAREACRKAQRSAHGKQMRTGLRQVLAPLL